MAASSNPHGERSRTTRCGWARSKPVARHPSTSLRMREAKLYGGKDIYGLDTFKSLERVLHEAMSDQLPPELIIATGDLVEDGSVQAYERLKGLLLATDVPVFVVPGNHDSITNMKSGLLGNNIQMPFSQKIQDCWWLVFLNSQVPGEGHGDLKPSELSRLETLAHAEPDISFLLSLHHTPNTQCSYPGCRLEGEKNCWIYSIPTRIFVA